MTDLGTSKPAVSDLLKRLHVRAIRFAQRYRSVRAENMALRRIFRDQKVVALILRGVIGLDDAIRSEIEPVSERSPFGDCDTCEGTGEVWDSDEHGPISGLCPTCQGSGNKPKGESK